MRKTTSTNFRNEAETIAGCPLAAAMALIGGRWKLLILWYVGHGLARFAEIRDSIPGISEKMLWQQLRELERTGLLLRVTEGRRVSYALTALGQSLWGPLGVLEQWSRDERVAERLLGVSPEPQSLPARSRTGTP